MNSVRSRRDFLNAVTKVALANTAVYVVGSAFSGLGGKLVAGAKTWTYLGYFGDTNPSSFPLCSPSTPSGPCPTLNAMCVNGLPICLPVCNNNFYRCQ